jgi:hypothetical protein
MFRVSAGDVVRGSRVGVSEVIDVGFLIR